MITALEEERNSETDCSSAFSCGTLCPLSFFFTLVSDAQVLTHLSFIDCLPETWMPKYIFNEDD